MTRSNVVLPQPDGPRMAKNSPSLTSSEMRSTAVIGAEALGDAVDLQQRAHAAASRLRRCDSSTRKKLKPITMVAMALISGVTPKRIMA